MSPQKTGPKPERRILAVDPRADRIGFAYFDDTGLADWGVSRGLTRHAKFKRKVFLIPALIWLLDRFQPTILILPDTPAGGVRRSDAVVEMIRAMASEAANRDTAVYFVSNAQVNAAFATDGGAARKSDIHEAIVKRYPELTAQMPRRRRAWDREGHNTPMFTAVSMWCAWRVQV